MLRAILPPVSPGPCNQTAQRYPHRSTPCGRAHGIPRPVHQRRPASGIAATIANRSPTDTARPDTGTSYTSSRHACTSPLSCSPTAGTRPCTATPTLLHTSAASPTLGERHRCGEPARSTTAITASCYTQHCALDTTPFTSTDRSRFAHTNSSCRRSLVGEGGMCPSIAVPPSTVTPAPPARPSPRSH